MTEKPTKQQFTAYQGLYDHLNRSLFEGKLPPCILNFSRHSNAWGFFAPGTWQDSNRRQVHEISLNPDHLGAREMRKTVATLVHEMVHLWQHEHGKQSRAGYHNAEWADRMELAGLMPSSTAEPGGKRVGQKVSHYIIKGGAFDKVFFDIPDGLLLPWKSRTTQSEGEKAKKAQKKASKTKYTCDGCDSNIWGKPGLNVMCADCSIVFVSYDTQDGDA